MTDLEQLKQEAVEAAAKALSEKGRLKAGGECVKYAHIVFEAVHPIYSKRIESLEAEIKRLTQKATPSPEPVKDCSKSWLHAGPIKEVFDHYRCEACGREFGGK